MPHIVQESFNRQQLAVLGAAVADAATLGMHWLYDQQRIKSLQPQSPEFHQHTREDYAGVKGFYAHEARACGQFSQYGEQLKAMLLSLMVNQGKYNRAHYQSTFVELFGYGGSYVGYIDRPTRATLDNIARADAEVIENQFHGADDSQIPALSKLPPLVAAHANDSSLPEYIESAVRVTNNNDEAVQYAQFFSSLLVIAIQTGDLQQVVEFAKSYQNRLISPLIKAAFENAQLSTPEATLKWGMACELNLGTPSIVHNLTKATSFAQSIRSNIYAGGDSCGRSIFLGAIVGACFGVEGADGIPARWIEKLADKSMMLEGIQLFYH